MDEVTKWATTQQSQLREQAARITALRAWAAFNDLALEKYGEDEGVNARRTANAIADALGDLTEEDWGVIRNAQRGYFDEAS